MRKSLEILMMALIVFALISCCGPRTCVEPTAATGIGQKWPNPLKIQKMTTHRGEPLEKAIRDPVFMANSRQASLNILILSGGGQNGAFGAGFLSGLAQQAASPDELNFDIVTGISTGALQATFAFLGPDYYGMLEAYYLNLSQSDIFAHRFFPSQLWSDSIVDSTPLRALLENTITLDMIEKVAQAHRDGRRLFIGTLDLDNGIIVTWDMGAIAQGQDQQALAKYHDVLMGAAAVPVVLPPVEIEYITSSGEVYKGLHVDGGLRENLFFRKFMLDIPESMPATAHLKVIVNGKIGLGYNCINTHWIPIAKRTLITSFDETMFNGVLRTYLIACSKKLEFKLMRIPDDVEMEEYGFTFDSALMQKLIDKGKELGQLDPVPWETNPPNAEEFIEICNQLNN